jgi:hypothetical protein
MSRRLSTSPDSLCPLSSVWNNGAFASSMPAAADEHPGIPPLRGAARRAFLVAFFHQPQPSAFSVEPVIAERQSHHGAHARKLTLPAQNVSLAEVIQ